MKLVILTIVVAIPYEGDFTTIKGVFETKSLAEEAMIADYNHRLANLIESEEKYPLWIRQSSSYRVPTEDNEYTYRDDVYTESYEFTEVTLGELINDHD